jgi:toxin-antitoxin system PIN domain toxin
MIVLDANLLLYAYNADAPQQPEAAKWLGDLAGTGEIIGLPWVTAWAFVRISTNPRIWSNPLPVKDAFAILGQWWDQPDVIPLQPGARHREILERLITEGHATGPLVTDAVLAVLAVENGATLASTDQNFARFRGLRWTNPLEGWARTQPRNPQK